MCILVKISRENAFHRDAFLVQCQLPTASVTSASFAYLQYTSCISIVQHDALK